jgi:hypothetical protein
MQKVDQELAAADDECLVMIEARVFKFYYRRSMWIEYSLIKIIN